MRRVSLVRPAEERAARTLIAPALLAILFFFLLPVVAALMLSFTDFDIYAVADLHNLRFIALDNYARLLSDPVFWMALRNTVYFVVIGAPLSIAVSLAAALLLDARLTLAKGLLRTAFFAPVVATLVAVAVVWRYLYHPRFGWIDQALGVLGIQPIDWLGDPFWAMPAIIILAVWKNFGYNMIIFLAGLQSIPETLYEAARIDGAGPWPRFRHITLPMLRPAFVFVTLMTSIGHFQLFSEPYVMTGGGGPANSTLSIALHMYKQGFRWWNIGYASAVSFVLFLIILCVSLFQLRIRRWQE